MFSILESKQGFNISVWKYCISVHEVDLFLCLFLIYFKFYFTFYFLVRGTSTGKAPGTRTGIGMYHFQLFFILESKQKRRVGFDRSIWNYYKCA